MSFKNKVIVVTGGSSGIGAATAIQFASEGADVVIVGRNESKLKNVSSKCESKGRKPLTIVADVTNDESVKKVVIDTVKYEKLYILINNAGKALWTSILHENALKDFDDVINTNLRSAVYFTILAAPHLVKTGGNIINISSIGSMMVRHNISAYCTSKAGLDHFTRSAALELSAKSVRVNAVNPGAVKTDFVVNMGMKKEAAEQNYAKLAELVPLGRVSESEEVVELVLYLASDKARRVTGSTLVLDNGQLLSQVTRDDQQIKQAFN